jgi:hypothetical protein
MFHPFVGDALHFETIRPYGKPVARRGQQNIPYTSQSLIKLFGLNLSMPIRVFFHALRQVQGAHELL